MEIINVLRVSFVVAICEWPQIGWDLSAVDDIECIGLTPAIVGACRLADVYTPHLVIVRDAQPVGVLYPPHLVYKIRSVCILSAAEPDGGALQPCQRHSKQ